MKKFCTLLLVVCFMAALMIPSVSFAEEKQLDPVRFVIVDETSTEFGAQSTSVFFAKGDVPEVGYAEKEGVASLKCVYGGNDPYLCLNLIPDVYQPILGAYSYAVMKVFYEPAEGSAGDPKICLRLFDSTGVWTQDNYRPYPEKGKWVSIVFDMTADSPYNEMWPAGSAPYTADLNITDSRIYFDPTNSAAGDTFYFNELVFFDTLEKAEAYANPAPETTEPETTEPETTEPETTEPETTEPETTEPETVAPQTGDMTVAAVAVIAVAALAAVAIFKKRVSC